MPSYRAVTINLPSDIITGIDRCNRCTTLDSIIIDYAASDQELCWRYTWTLCFICLMPGRCATNTTYSSMIWREPHLKEQIDTVWEREYWLFIGIITPRKNSWVERFPFRTALTVCRHNLRDDWTCAASENFPESVRICFYLYAKLVAWNIFFFCVCWTEPVIIREEYWFVPTRY